MSVFAGGGLEKIEIETMNLSELLKDSAYKPTQYKPAQIVVVKAVMPYGNCRVRGKGLGYDR